MQRHQYPDGTTLAIDPVPPKSVEISREARTLLQPFAALVSEFVVEELRTKGAAGVTARYYTSRTSPLPRKAFLAAARAHHFPSFVIKRRVYALCDDVHRFMESSGRRMRKTTTNERSRDEIGRLLDEANLRRRGRR